MGLGEDALLLFSGFIFYYYYAEASNHATDTATIATPLPHTASLDGQTWKEDPSLFFRIY